MLPEDYRSINRYSSMATQPHIVMTLRVINGFGGYTMSYVVDSQDVAHYHLRRTWLKIVGVESDHEQLSV